MIYCGKKLYKISFTYSFQNWMDTLFRRGLLSRLLVNISVLVLSIQFKLCCSQMQRTSDFLDIITCDAGCSWTLAQVRFNRNLANILHDSSLSTEMIKLIRDG